MITHIARIATTPRAHDLGYGFLLTKVFEHLGVELKKRVDAQVIDEIGSSTIMGCDFALVKVGDRCTDQGVQPPSVPVPGRSEDHGVQTPPVPVPRPTQSQPATSTTVSSPQRLQDKLTTLQSAFQEEKELNAKRLLALLTALQPKSPAP